MNTNPVNQVTNNYKNEKPQKNTKSNASDEFSKILENYSDNQIVISANTNIPSTELSPAGKEYLQKLMAMYPDTEFIIEDFNSEEEANNLMNSSSSAFCCVIKPDLIEKMASDESYRIHYEQIIADADMNLRKLKDELGDDCRYFEAFSYSVDENGNVLYSTKYKNEEAEQISAASLEEFIEKLRQSLKLNQETADKNDMKEEIYVNMML